MAKKEPPAVEKKDDEKKHLVTVLGSLHRNEQGNKTDTADAENVSLIIKEWLDPKHIRRKTRYTKRQVLAISVLQSLANTYTIKTLKRFLDEYRTSKLSEDGKSSAELESILKSRMPESEESRLDQLSKFLQ